MRTSIPLQNIHYEGCFCNVERALLLVEGVTLDRCALMAAVDFEAPATVEAQLAGKARTTIYVALASRVLGIIGAADP